MTLTRQLNKMGRTVTRTVTTSRSNLSNNALIVAAELLGKFLVGQRIRGSDIDLLNQLMINLCGHTHTWVDLYGQHTYGNQDGDGYSNGRTTTRTTSRAFEGAGLPPPTLSGYRIYANHVNFGIDLHNQILSHSHTSIDQES